MRSSGAPGSIAGRADHPARAHDVDDVGADLRRIAQQPCAAEAEDIDIDFVLRRRLSGRFWPIRRPLFRGSRCREETEFSVLRRHPFPRTLVAVDRLGKPTWKGRNRVEAGRLNRGADPNGSVARADFV